MLYTERFTGPVYLRFLERLIRDPSRKIFVIVDRHPVHFRQQVQQWLAVDYASAIEVF